MENFLANLFGGKDNTNKTPFLVKLFGTDNERNIKYLEENVVKPVSEAYKEIQQLSNDELRGKTAEFKQRIHDALRDVQKRIYEKKLMVETEQDITPYIPDDLLCSKYDHIWVRIDGADAYIGVTAYETMFLSNQIIDSVGFAANATDMNAPLTLKKGDVFCNINSIASIRASENKNATDMLEGLLLFDKAKKAKNLMTLLGEFERAASHPETLGPILDAIKNEHPTEFPLVVSATWKDGVFSIEESFDKLKKAVAEKYDMLLKEVQAKYPFACESCLDLSGNMTDIDAAQEAYVSHFESMLPNEESSIYSYLLKNAFLKETDTLSKRLPFDAEVAEFNTELLTNPALVRTDPYGQGWIAKVKADNVVGGDLVSAAEYGQSLIKSIEEKERIFKEIDDLKTEAYAQTQKVLGELLPEAFAVMKEAARRFKENKEVVVNAAWHDVFLARMCDNVTIEGDKAIYKNSWSAGGNMITWDMCHYDVQLIGGAVLHGFLPDKKKQKDARRGLIAEMATGEGKTLVATLSVYLNALAGQGVHVVTVNDYLAKRDSEWMGGIYHFLGLNVDCIDKHKPNSFERRNAYMADITYGTNNEFGFDYLRDNMSNRTEELVQRPLWKKELEHFSPDINIDTFTLQYVKEMQRYASIVKMQDEGFPKKKVQELTMMTSMEPHNYALVDEVDSVLIDDARTPLIISGPTPRGDQQEFNKYKPNVERLYKAQEALVGKMLTIAHDLVTANPEIKPTELGAQLLLRCHRALPKSKRLIKFLSEPGIKNVLLRTENFYMAENNRNMFIIDNDLNTFDDETNEKIHNFSKKVKDFNNMLDHTPEGAHGPSPKDAANLRKEVVQLINDCQTQLGYEIIAEDSIKFAKIVDNLVIGYKDLAFLNKKAGNEAEHAPKPFADYLDMMVATLNDKAANATNSESKEAFKEMLNKLQEQSAEISDDFRLTEMADVNYGKYGLLFVIEEKINSVNIMEKGIDTVSSNTEEAKLFIMPDIGTELSLLEEENLDPKAKAERKAEIYREFATASERIHTIQQLLRAYTMFRKDDEYVIMDNKVKIVDEQTGRIMEGRRYSDGLHQAIEAKEDVKVEAATQTYATVTLQNYFRMYKKLAGMTGTAETEAAEFWKIYKLEVVVVPTNRPIIRIDAEDMVFKTKREKLTAVVDKILELNSLGRPVLVGTTSVEDSELISTILTRRHIAHNVLNAKLHKKEADIVAAAGQSGTVTISTNMAGRGTDIKLGPGVKELGGLAIIGTERHDSRRVDRQLRGRAGRQGDPGSSQFYISLEDKLMRLFGSERISKVMDTIGLKEGEVIQHSMITKSIERAQKKVEENHFGVRKHLIEYDDVMNSQRDTIYRKRRNALFGERLSIDISQTIEDMCANIVDTHWQDQDYDAFVTELYTIFGCDSPFSADEFDGKPEYLIDKLYAHVYDQYKKKIELLADTIFPYIEGCYMQELPVLIVKLNNNSQEIYVALPVKQCYENKMEIARCIEKDAVIQIIDNAWKEHLRDLDDLRQEVQNASYEQKDPLVIYKLESFNLFDALLERINRKTMSFLCNSPEINYYQRGQQKPPTENKQLQTSRGESGPQPGSKGAEPIRVKKKLGRNDLCDCGSGKKYKNCCGKGE